jgi:hypothetical protein
MNNTGTKKVSFTKYTAFGEKRRRHCTVFKKNLVFMFFE